MTAFVRYYLQPLFTLLSCMLILTVNNKNLSCSDGPPPDMVFSCFSTLLNMKRG